MIRGLLHLFTALLLLALAACAVVPALHQHPPVADISAFAFSGRIAVRQGDTRHHLKIDWHHEADHDEILLTTPLGQGLAELSRDAAGAVLILSDRRRFAAPDWSALSAKVFGFELPLEASARWLLGDMKRAEGWQVTVIERESEAPGALPTLIELEREDIFIRLKIDEWSDVR